MTPEERAEVLEFRRQCRLPLHSPPHLQKSGYHRYHLSAANYEHRTIIGKSLERIKSFSGTLCDTLSTDDNTLFAWCVLPNHWHALVGTSDLDPVLKEIAQLHGRSSFQWNKEEDARGRQCWHCCTDRKIRSEAHFYAVRNYVHHNPVNHGYTQHWQDWPFSSAIDFLQQVGREEALRYWREYPPLDMGKGWDD